MAKGSAIPGYDVLVLKRRGVTRDLPSGTKSLTVGYEYRNSDLRRT